MTLRYLVPLIAWLAAIFIMSSIPNPPGATGSSIAPKVAHVVVYAILAVLAIRYARVRFPRQGLPVLVAGCWLFAVAYGITDEIHQAFVPRRNPSVLDVGLDALGAAIGLGLWLLWQRLALPGARYLR